MGPGNEGLRSASNRPVATRVDGTAKTVLLGLIDDAVAAGWTRSRVCLVLGV